MVVQPCKNQLATFESFFTDCLSRHLHFGLVCLEESLLKDLEFGAYNSLRDLEFGAYNSLRDLEFSAYNSLRILEFSAYNSLRFL